MSEKEITPTDFIDSIDQVINARMGVEPQKSDAIKPAESRIRAALQQKITDTPGR